MDRRVIETKLERLRRCVQRLEHKRPSTPEALATDYDLQDILSVNLERAVQLCVDIAAHIIAERESSAPTTMAAAFEALHTLHILSSDLANSMKKAVGFRNIVVHNYQEHIFHHLPKGPTRHSMPRNFIAYPFPGDLLLGFIRFLP